MSVTDKGEHADICIVSNAPISQNPRAEKEAKSLVQAGYAVVVVYARHAEWTRPYDEAIEENGNWVGVCVNIAGNSLGARFRRLWTGIRIKCFRVLANVGFYAGIADGAFCRFFYEQLSYCRRIKARLYIAHNPQSLPIAARAAASVNAKYAFDAEDFHLGEYGAGEEKSLDYRLLQYLERRYLPNAAYVTAAAPLIGARLGALYGIHQIPTIYNVFSWMDRGFPCVSDRKDNERKSVSFYWFSQIISRDRGLEDVIAAFASARGMMELHLRGDIDEDYKHEIEASVSNYGSEKRVVFHATVAPDELICRAMGHDVGLCLERNVPENRNLCLTNKIFLFMLAGLPLIVTETAGQLEFLRHVPGCALSYRPGDVGALVRILEKIVSDRKVTERMREASTSYAQERWNWERESKSFVEIVKRAIADGE